MSAYTQWTRGYARDLVRRELMDTSGKWWTDGELNQYVNDWMNTLQQEYELVWGSATLTTAVNTLTLSNFASDMLRLDAVYYGTGTSSGYRLAGRTLEDLEILSPEWRSATGDTPRLVIQYDYNSMIVWPPLTQTGTFIFEYPTQLALLDDNQPIPLPVWTQWSLKPYVAFRAYLRPGPVNDTKKALRYQAQFLRAKTRIKSLWDNYIPERFRKLKPAGHYEWDIITPPPAWDTGNNGAVSISQFQTYVPIGSVDGYNTSFTILAKLIDLKVFVNGVLQSYSTDYTWSVGSTTVITFAPSTIPKSGDEIVVWGYTTQ